MRKIFIDLGGHVGQAIDRFYQEVEDAADWMIYSFEPIQFRALCINMKKYKNVQVISSAAGIKDCMLTMYPVPSDGQGATSLKGKYSGSVQYDSEVNVPCINFIRWFKEQVHSTDFVIIKINIEGGEYVLMPHLHEILDNINGAYIKLHHNKFITEEKKDLETIFHNFEKEIVDFKAFIFCDVCGGVGNEYKFKWLIEQSERKDILCQGK